MRGKFSLKFRLIVIVGLITFLSTALLAHLASRFSRDQIQSDQGLLLQEIVNSMASRLGQDLNTRASEILLLTHMDAIRDSKVSYADKRKIFEALKSAYPFYAWIGITDQHGNILAGTDNLLVGKNVAKRDWFLEGSKGLHFGNAHDAFLLAKLMPKPKWDDLPLRLVDVSAPVLTDDGKLLGVICGHLSLDWAFEARGVLLDNIGEHDIDLVVLNDSGKVLMGTPRLPSLQVDLSQLSSWTALARGEEAPLVERWPDGKHYLTVIARESTYKSYSGMGWAVIARKPEMLAFAPARRIANSILGIGFASALLLGWFIWFFIGHQLRPLQAISAAARRIGNGDIKSEIPRIEGQDEIAVVSQSLSELVASLISRNEELRLSNRVFEESAQGIVITDNEQRIVRVNQAFSDITHYSPEEVLGNNPSLLGSGRHDKEFYTEMWRILNERGIWRGEIWNRNKLGEVYPEWLTISLLRDEHGEVSHYIGLFTDISDKKAHEEELLRMANYDPLTELPNRNLLQEHIQEAIDLSMEGGRFSLLFIDLDKFKHINDTIGHPSGDIILQEVAGRLLSISDVDCTLARWGGDEFVLLIPGSGVSQATAMAKRILTSLSRPFELEGVYYHLGASIGIASYPEDSTSVEGLLRCADTAMYKAKRSGENHYQFYESAMNSSVERFLVLDNAMRGALNHNMVGFSLVYQPQYDIDGKNITGVEALVRWDDPVLGTISPAEFIPVAEDAKLINILGQWIFNTAMRQFREYLDRGGKAIRLSLNCSPHQLLDQKFILLLTGAAKQYDIPPHLLRLEVTESAIMNDEKRVVDVLGQLRERGYSIAIDDFGTGFACLHYIQRLQPREIKIDRSFVQTAVNDENSRNIISFTVGLAQSMGIDVVAEGVETTEQLEVLRAFDKVTIQGYLYSKPLPFESFMETLTKLGG